MSWFSRNSLKEAFSGLDATLRFSVGELSLVEAAFDFNPSSANTNANGDKNNMLPLKVRSEDRVSLIDLPVLLRRLLRSGLAITRLVSVWWLFLSAGGQNYTFAIQPRQVAWKSQKTSHRNRDYMM